MIANPLAATVLCYGDSNTHGAPADDRDYVRLPPDMRWTGVLQNLLGDDHYVVEEGLNGRTTDLDYRDRTGCNGRTLLEPCLRTHEPVELVVLMLGTNDLKIEFDRSAAEIAAAVDGLVTDIGTHAADRAGGTPSIVLVSPVHVDDTCEWFAELNSDCYDAASAAKSRQLAAELRRVADAHGTLFADAAEVALPGPDGVHLSTDSHRPLAELIASRCRQRRRPGRA